jgi:alkanesulfonate monooxygenase SsuD/methylene tetrahydromethanopterin reductase-like flavin-dependent oxidoreductase (luciferase family)
VSPGADAPLGVAFGWSGLGFGELLDLVERAEALGYAAAYVPGDVSLVPSLGDAPVLDGWTLTTALLARTRRIAIGSIRLVHHWRPARLAQAVATAEQVAPGRLRLLISIGGHPADRRFGLPLPPPADRVAWLAELLPALQALWRGEEVSLAGRFVQLESVRIRPALPAGRPLVEVAGRGPRMLALAAAHADAWNLNLPALASRVRPATRRLEEACRQIGRDPQGIARVLWIFARPEAAAGGATLRREFRRLNPWLGPLSDAEVDDALLAGGKERCRERLAALRRELALDLPVVDLSGLPHDAARRALALLAPAGGASEETRVDSGSCST